MSLRGCDELIPLDNWVRRLARSERTGMPLRIKLGLDPTKTEIRYNSEWNLPLGSMGMIQLTATIHRGPNDGA